MNRDLLRKIFIASVILDVLLICAIPWVFMDPNVFRIPAAIVALPFLMPVLFLLWTGDWSATSKMVKNCLPDLNQIQK